MGAAGSVGVPDEGAGVLCVCVWVSTNPTNPRAEAWVHATSGRESLPLVFPFLLDRTPVWPQWQLLLLPANPQCEAETRPEVVKDTRQLVDSRNR